MNSCKEPSNEHVDLLMPGASMDFHDEICQVSLGGVGSVMPLSGPETTQLLPEQFVIEEDTGDAMAMTVGSEHYCGHELAPSCEIQPSQRLQDQYLSDQLTSPYVQFRYGYSLRVAQAMTGQATHDDQLWGDQDPRNDNGGWEHQIQCQTDHWIVTDAVSAGGQSIVRAEDASLGQFISDWSEPPSFTDQLQTLEDPNANVEETKQVYYVQVDEMGQNLVVPLLTPNAAVQDHVDMPQSEGMAELAQEKPSSLTQEDVVLQELTNQEAAAGIPTDGICAVKQCRRFGHPIKNLKRHYEENHYNGVMGARKITFICDECGKTFAQRAHLNSHVATKHTGPSKKPKDVDPASKTLQCPHCPKKYKGKSGLDKHVNSVHLNLRVTCHLCSKDFRQKVHLHNHIKAQHHLDVDDLKKTRVDYKRLASDDKENVQQVKRSKKRS